MNEIRIGIKDQCFGVEIEMTGITRETAAKALADYFGTAAVHVGGTYDKWAVVDREGKEWNFASDSSIHAERRTNSGYVGTDNRLYQVEMVTPKLTYSELPKFQECIRQVRRPGAKVNSSCGLHVHIDGANHNQQSLKNLLGIMFSKEDILFKALRVDERRAERWCQRVREDMAREARSLPSNNVSSMDRFESAWYEESPDRTDQLRYREQDHYDYTRYYALNLHSFFYRGTVEFRCFNSTLHAGRAKAYVNLCLAISAQAINQKSAIMRRTQSDNELFTFRTWLVRMGLNGSEFKTTRDHLTKYLEGDRAWRHGRPAAELPGRNPHEMER